MKRYISKSGVSLNVVLNGTRRRVCFDSLSNGGSAFTTNDPALIEALESLSYYGTMFYEDPFYKDEDVVEEVVSADGETPSEESAPIESDVVVFEEVTTCADAKEILVERGAKVSQLKNKSAILSIAESLGVSFPNL